MWYLPMRTARDHICSEYRSILDRSCSTYDRIGIIERNRDYEKAIAECYVSLLSYETFICFVIVHSICSDHFLSKKYLFYSCSRLTSIVRMCSYPMTTENKNTNSSMINHLPIDNFIDQHENYLTWNKCRYHDAFICCSSNRRAICPNNGADIIVDSSESSLTGG
jgi:hypothetical protein